jgi:DNA-binding transcriptional ArsR family regulator
MTAAQISETIGFHPRQVTGHLALLKKAGLIAGWEIAQETKKIRATYRRGQARRDRRNRPARRAGGAGRRDQRATDAQPACASSAASTACCAPLQDEAQSILAVS